MGGTDGYPAMKSMLHACLRSAGWCSAQCSPDVLLLYVWEAHLRDMLFQSALHLAKCVQVDSRRLEALPSPSYRV